MNNAIISALLNKSLYSHEVSGFQVIETHLSWIILTGEFAYKIKKAVNLGFQDFTTLEKRHYYCQQEITLNRRFNSHMYVDLVKITGTFNHLSLNGDGPVLEYAIKMLQFPQEHLLSHLAGEKKIYKADIDFLAREVSNFHSKTEVCDISLDYSSPNKIYSDVIDNFTSLEEKPHYSDEKLFQYVKNWSKSRYEELKSIFLERKQSGFIRACHGDLHLNNIVMINSKPTIFDYIEFNEEFRWIDTINDVAFLCMDLYHKNMHELSNYFINKYLEYSGDYLGVKLLDFYQCYRAMIRAKVANFRLCQLSNDNALFDKTKEEVNDYLNIGYSLTQNTSAKLAITFGLSGSGKTHYTDTLLMQTEAIRLRSDVIRKNMFANTIEPNEMYSTKATQAVYLKMAELAEDLLHSGKSVIIDATCLKRWQRDLFINLSKKLGIEINIYHFDAPINILEARIANRKFDISDADVEVLKKQLLEIEHLSDEEKELTKQVHKNM